MDLKSLQLFLFLGGLTCLTTFAAAQVANNQILISNCYQNNTAYNRYTRQPVHIDNLISIIRKIEEKTLYQWDNRRLSRTIIHQFQFDGLNYDAEKKNGYEYESASTEAAHTSILRDILPSNERLPDGILNNDELCALHWMLSHSINATMRDDEGLNQWQYRPKRSASEHGVYDIEHLDKDDDEYHRSQRHSPKSERVTIFAETPVPLETGVVHTKWGPIAAGRLLGGIAAGLEPMQMYVQIVAGGYGSNGYVPLNIPGPNTGSNNGNGFTPENSAGSGQWNQYGQPSYRPSSRRYKRQTTPALPALYNYHAATLAGDVGQAAILNAVFRTPSQNSPPSGQFNDTICPREYVLHALANSDHDVSHDHDTWSYMTAAEIRGGMDGLLLGLQMQNFNRYGYRLSELLSMYYSERGIVGEYRYRACNRNSLFAGTINPTELLDQAKSFGYIYSNRTSSRTVTVNTVEGLQKLYALVEETYQKMTGTISGFSSTDPACVLRENSGTELPEADKVVNPKLTVYAVLDHSDTDLTQQKRFLAQLAFELGVSPKGSRLGVVNGATGQILLKPNNTDNPSTLACDILSLRVFPQSQNGIVSTLRSLYTEIERIKLEEERIDYADQNGIVILVLNQGVLFEETMRADIRSALIDMYNTLGDVHVVYATSKFQTSDYDKFALYPEYDIIRIQNAANLSTEAARFVTDLTKITHARITYPRCNKNRYDQSNEQMLPQTFFVSPNTLEYYQMSPDYFYSAKKLQMRFSSTNGKVRVCMSRSNRFPNSGNADTSDEKEKNKRVVCKETSGVSQPISESSGNKDIEFNYEKPCGGDGTRAKCGPIYVSITPITTVADGSTGLDCTIEGCQYPDQVKVVFTHYDMRCNGALQNVLSLSAFLLATLATLLTFSKYS